MRTLGAEVVYPLEDPPKVDTLQYEGDIYPVHTIACRWLLNPCPLPGNCGSLTTISDHEFASVLEEFITMNFEHDPDLTNIADLVAWNEAHADVAMPERVCHPPFASPKHSTNIISSMKRTPNRQNWSNV